MIRRSLRSLGSAALRRRRPRQAAAQDTRTPRLLVAFVLAASATSQAGCFAEEPSEPAHPTPAPTLVSSATTATTTIDGLQATTGAVFPNNIAGRLDVARASGAQDLHCKEPIDARDISEYPHPLVSDDYRNTVPPSSLSLVADGCGQRALYKGAGRTVLLVSIVRLDPHATSYAASSAP